MTNKQLVIFYCVFLGVIISLALLVESMFRKPMSAEQFANKFCQETYGPQVAAYWVADKMMCITQRGEILPAKKPKD
jgi:hypothetical protein